MRFAEIEGSVVRYVLPPELAPDYKILVQNQVEIALDADVVPGDVYENGAFSRFVLSEEELQAQARPSFEAQRIVLFAQTQWVRERYLDWKDEKTLGLIDDATLATYKALYAQWLIYWRTLRNMPDQPGFDPSNPQWPEQPE